MKKILVILAIAVALVMPLMANGSSEQGGAEKNVTLKIGFQANTSSILKSYPRCTGVPWGSRVG